MFLKSCPQHMEEDLQLWDGELATTNEFLASLFDLISY